VTRNYNNNIKTGRGGGTNLHADIKFSSESVQCSLQPLTERYGLALRAFGSCDISWDEIFTTIAQGHFYQTLIIFMVLHNTYS